MDLHTHQPHGQTPRGAYLAPESAAHRTHARRTDLVRRAQRLIRTLAPAPGHRQWASLVLLGALAGCGGGGSSSDPVGSRVTLSGTAATGAPMVGATVVVIDRTGAQVQLCQDPAGVEVTCTTQPDGRFTLSLRSGAQAPLVLTATPLGDGMAQVSMTGDALGGTVNITPITTLIAASLAPNGDPHLLQPSDFDASGLSAAVAEIVAVLKPLLDAAGTTADPLTGVFAADGTGMDKALDALDVQVTTDAAGQATVAAEIRLNGDEAQPARVSMVGGGTPVASNMSSVTSAALPLDGLAPQMRDLLDRLTACYNLPYAQRVNATTSPVSVGASVCRELFVDNNPATYKHNGHRAGPAQAGQLRAFTGMFRNRDTSGPSGAANTLVFEQPTYEFTRSGTYAGDVVLTYHWRDLLGNEDWDQAVVRAQGGRLKFVGNQYNFDARVRPFAQRREFVDAAAAGFSYDATGYNTWVRNHQDATGAALFHRVEVTTPSGRKLTLWPGAGLDRLSFRRANGTLSGSQIINLQWAYWSGGSVGASGVDLANLETGRVFARDGAGNPAPWTSEQIRAIPNQGRWRFDFFLAGNTGTTPDETQWHSTLSRALTLEEFRALPMPSLAPQLVADLRADIVPDRGGVPVVDLTPSSEYGPQVWTVPAGAIAPTYVSAILNFEGTSISDGVSVLSTQRSASILCSKASAGDQHCVLDGSGNSTGAYRPGNVLNGLELWARTPRAEERSSFYAFYRRLP